VGRPRRAPDPRRHRAGADHEGTRSDRRNTRRAPARRPGGLRLGGIAPVTGPYCQPCSARRRYVGRTYPPAVARIEWPGLVPSPVDLCADCLATARAEQGRALSVIERFGAYAEQWREAQLRYAAMYAQHDRSVAQTTAASERVALASREREAAGRPPLSGNEIMAIAGYGGYRPPVGARARPVPGTGRFLPRRRQP
jgi:hypothetical protein